MTEINPQQILVPKKVYIGDSAELRCTFNCSDNTLKTLTAQGTLKLTNDSFVTSTKNENTSDFSDYSIKSISLSPAGVDFYQISIQFVPWKTGEIVFSPLNIEDTDVFLIFQPINIVSLINSDEKGTTILRDTAAPLLLPGTTYKLYGIIAIVLIVFITGIHIFVKRKSILFFINTKRLLKRYKKNKKNTINQLRQLLSKKDLSDKTLAETMQYILRKYLEVRFDYPFTKAAASEIMSGFQKATGGLLSPEKEEAFEAIALSFVRTDFIRYSQKSSFKNKEFSELVEKIIQNIEILELSEKQEDAKDA